MLSQSARLQQLAEGVFQELAMKKRRLAAEGHHIIDLSVGSPDLPPPPHVIAALNQAVADASQYGYAIAAMREFNEAVATFYERYGVTVDPACEVLQLMGSQDGLAHLALAIINPGDVVLLPDPGYPIYEASIRLAGGHIHPFPIDEATLHPNFDAVPKQLLDKAKLMILNYPSNPTAGVATKEMFEAVVRVAKSHDIFVAHDFAYSEMTFGDRQAISILTIPESKDFCIEFNSLSKTFNMAGCRIGYMVGNPDVIGHLRKLKSHIDFGVFLPIQQAAIAALTTPWDGLQRQREIYTTRRDAFVSALSQNGWVVPSPAATMFVWARIPTSGPSYAFALDLLQKVGVAVTPGAAFGALGEGHVRMAIVSETRQLEEAAHRISQYLNGTSSGNVR